MNAKYGTSDVNPWSRPLDWSDAGDPDMFLRAVEGARRGVYSEHEVSRLPRELREKYFVREDSSYRICHEVRRCVWVTRHDLLRDPLYMAARRLQRIPPPRKPNR